MSAAAHITYSTANNMEAGVARAVKRNVVTGELTMYLSVNRVPWWNLRARLWTWRKVREFLKEGPVWLPM